MDNHQVSKSGLTHNDKILVPNSERQQIGCGLVNYKKNCFFNSVIQALFHSPVFVDCLKKIVENHVDCVTCCVRDTYEEMKETSKTRILWNLYNLLKKMKVSILNGKQQDAHELLLVLFDKMNNPGHSAPSLTKIFDGNLTSSVACSMCNTTSETIMSFTTLQIPILRNSTVNGLLKKYFSVEQIFYKCERCKNDVVATRKFTIANAPISLVLTISRFSDLKTKASNFIYIRKSIDLSQYLRDKQEKTHKLEYNLVAIVNHKGKDLYQGHYTATAKSNANNWYEFDDSRVFRITNADGNFISEDAYILFYELVDHSKGSTKNLETPIPHIEGDGMLEELIPIEIIDDADTDLNDSPPEVVDAKDTETSELIPEEVVTIDDGDSDLSGLIPVEIIDATDSESGELMSIDFVDGSDTELAGFMNNENVSCTESLYEKSLNSSKTEIGNEECDKLSGRRIVDIEYFLKQFQEMNTNVCKICNIGNMVFEKETKRALMSIFTFRCSNCEKSVRINSCAPKNVCQSNVNQSAVLGIVSIGLGFYHLQEFLAHMDINCMSYSTFHRLDGQLQADWWKLAKQFEAEALNEEIRLAKANNQVDSAGNALVEAEIDGSWCKRSFGNNFSSLSGCAAIIGRRTNKIVYSGVKNKYCHICKIAESRDMTPRVHECKANYTGSSCGMETEIIIDGFKFCNEKGARFHLLVGDGDSSTYKAIRDLNLYKDPDMDTEKLYCENHVYKNFNKKCGALHTNTSFKKCGRKLLPIDIGNNISKGVRMAAKHWRESDIELPEKYLNLEKDIMNAPLHYLGIHDGCSDYFCNKETDPEARESLAVLKESSVYYELLDICQFYLFNNSKSLIAGLSTNQTEGFNSLICKTLGGKRVCNSLDGNSYQARTAIADVHYNTKGHSGSTFHEITYGGVKESCLKLENARKRKVKQNAIYKDNKAKKPKLEGKNAKTKAKPKRYGVGHEELDWEESVFETAKQRFLEKLTDNQNNRSSLVKETVLQRSSFKWMKVRKGLLTSSYFSRVLKANNRKSYTKIIEEIIHKNVQYSNTAELRHQRWYQLEALPIFSRIYGSEPISQCGIFIDPQFCFIGATPFRLYGGDGIIVVKCPKKAFKMTIAEALDKKLLPIFQGPLHDRKINRKSHWYYEIQGQLHVTGRRIAYVMIYLGESIYEIIELERNDTFWREEMEKELIFFYNEGLLKELVNPRYDRGMEFRKYDPTKETFS